MKKVHNYAIVWGIIVLIIIILLTIFGFVYKDKSKVYKDLEEKIVEAVKKYADAKFLYPKSGENVKTTADVLIEEGFMEELKVGDEVCEGYVILSFKNSVYDYKGYVKCKNYVTKGYSE